MAYGITVQNNSYSARDQKKRAAIVNKIKRVVAKYGLDDEEWSEAISSQYFLLCLAKQLAWTKSDYGRLLNKCLSSFNITYTDGYVLDSKKILITPDETNRIIACMQDEDNIDDYYTHSAKMKAENINAEQMYFNFHYGLLIRIVSSENTEVFQAIKHLCLDRLTDASALDDSDGWYPYRVPWITARILISLKNIDYSSYSKHNEVEEIIKSSLTSLYQRIDEKAAFWRSGVGKWVSKWESTALCLEALLEWDSIKDHNEEIGRIIDYVCSDENSATWLNNSVSFRDEESANDTLSATILASVIYRVTKQYFPDKHEEISTDILRFFSDVITLIDTQKVKSVRQYCTIPQILHYVMAAIDE